MTTGKLRIAVIGAGAIGMSFAGELRSDDSFDIASYDCREAPEFLPGPYAHLYSIDQLVTWRPHLVVECAGHHAVSTAVPPILRAGFDVVISSVGALAYRQVRQTLREASMVGNSSVLLIAGAVGGIDALSAAARSGLTEVRYTGRKPPRAWVGTPAEKQVDLSQITSPTVIFTGTAEQAATLYPQNANVAATIALHGIGFERTEVTLIADPSVTENCHEIYAHGPSGELRVSNSNSPFPANPKTSWLAALSLQARVIERLKGLQMEISE
jgi:aspartate dehydrogenase